MTTHFQRALILYRLRRFINHLLTYLLTIEKLQAYRNRTEKNIFFKIMTRQWDQTVNLKRSRRELSHCAGRQLGGNALKRPYKL